MNSDIYSNIIEDMYKIYLFGIDSNYVRRNQPINNKYTTIDETMLSVYIYLKILEKSKFQNDNKYKVIANALIKQLVNSQTGNMGVDVENKEELDLYNRVKKDIINEKIAYMNRNLKVLKINLEDTEEDNIFKFSEELAALFILINIYLSGNELSYNYIEKKIEFLSKYNLDNVPNCINEIKDFITSVLPQNLENKQNLINCLKTHNQMREFYNLVSVANNLMNVYRFSQSHLIIPGNVMFHQYINTVMATIIINYLHTQGEDFINKDKALIINLFHDFGEYKGNEIISSMKSYSKESKKMYEDIEERDENELKNLIGNEFFNLIKQYKTDKEGYIIGIIDKIIGIMKVLIEFEFYQNKNMLRMFKPDECKRFEKFYNYEKVEESKNKYFYTNLLKLHYIYIINKFLKHEEDMYIYWSKEEILAIRDSIEKEKERLTLERLNIED